MPNERLQRLRQQVLTQIDIKVLAAVLAVVIFYGVRGVISNTMVLHLPVELDVDDAQVAILSLEPSTVRVTLRGALSELRQLVEEDMSITLRPRSINATGIALEPVNARHVRGRGTLQVVNIDPNQVRVTYDRQDTRVFTVAPPVLLGKPGRGRAEVEFDPREVRVRGAERHLDQLQAAYLQLQTEPVDVDGRMQSFTRRLRVLSPEEDWLAEITPREINARVNIVLETITREIEFVPVQVMQSAGDLEPYSLTPTNVTVWVSGRPEVVQRLEPRQLTVFVDVRELSPPAGGEATLRIFIPPGLGLETATVEPRQVSVKRMRREPPDA